MKPDDESLASPTPVDQAACAARAASALPPVLPPIPEGISCPDCEYDLRGLTGACCPECGLDLGIVRIQAPQIAWARRAEIGRRRAYWQTVWLVCRQPRRFFMEIVRPVSYRDSQKFRWLIVLHTVAAVLVSWVITLDTWDIWSRFNWIVSLLTVALAVGVLLVVLPSAGSYALESRRIPPERRNRGIALSYYGWAPLNAFILMPVFTLIAWGTNSIWPSERYSAAFAVTASCYLSAILFPLAGVAMAEARLAGLARRVLGKSPWLWLRVVGSNVVALTVLALIALIPLGILYLMIVWYSLH